MQTDSSANSLASPLGAAHLAWSAILCAGGIYGLAASQPASRELGETLGFWNQCFAATGVSAIVALALLHAWGGQSLRRGGEWPGAIGWGLITAGAILALTSLGVLACGMQSKLLLAGAVLLVAVLLAGGAGTLALSTATRWLARRVEGPGDEGTGATGESEANEDATETGLLQIALASIPILLSAGTMVVALCCEAMSGSTI